MTMKPCAALIALVCLFTLSLATHAPSFSDDPSTQIALPKEEESIPAVVDLTKIPFRMVNRRFPTRSKRPCHHHRKVLPTETRIVEIFPGGENGDFEEPMVSGEGRRFPGRWLRLPHHRHHHRRHHQGDDFVSDGFDRVGREKGIRASSEKGSFMRSVRKFLNNYF